jgi:hypothetical protein
MISKKWILTRVIHGWSDGHCVRLLGSCAKGMVRGGWVPIIEMVVPPGNEFHLSKLLDLELLAMTHGGRERTAADFEGLLARAGFRLEWIVPTRRPASIVEATRG